MTNLNEAKKNLFKIKKLVETRRAWNGEIIDTNEFIGVVRPYFNTRSKSFDDNYISVITLDGDISDFNIANIEFKTTRITNEKIKKEAEKLINYSKSNYKLELEEEKLYSDFEAKKRKMQEKNTKKQGELKKIFNGLDKAKGILTPEDFIAKMSKDLSIDLKPGYTPSSYYSGEKFYGTHIGEYVFSVGFLKEKISTVNLYCSYDIDRWASPSKYDFLMEEYDRTIHVTDLDKSKDFEKLKYKYFGKSKSDSYKHNVSESFDIGVGDKDLSISKTLNLSLMLERNKSTYKDVCSKMKYFLSLV